MDSTQIIALIAFILLAFGVMVVIVYFITRDYRETLAKNLMEALVKTAIFVGILAACMFVLFLLMYLAWVASGSPA